MISGSRGKADVRQLDLTQTRAAAEEDNGSQFYGRREMTKKAKLLGLIMTAALFTGIPLSAHYSPTKVASISFDHAEARVGRPLTPMSVAGVNRRVHRRAYYGAAAGAAAVGTAAAYGAYRRSTACGYYSYPPCY